MKVSLHVPRESDADSMRRFLRSELAESRNIRSKQTRKAVSAGLGKIINVVEPGYSFYTDGFELVVEPYDGI